MLNLELSVPGINDITQKNISEYLEASLSLNTRQAYQSQWRNFCMWLRINNRAVCLPVNVQDIIDYIVIRGQQQISVASIKQFLAMIKLIHSTRSILSPTDYEVVKKISKGYARLHGKKIASKDALKVEDLEKMVRYCDRKRTLKSVRDKAILLLGFCGAFRRSELSSLNVEDLVFDGTQIRIHVRHSKTDQNNQGMMKAIFLAEKKILCPVEAIVCWLKESEVIDGRLFRAIDRHGNLKESLSAQSIALILRRLLRETELRMNYSAHSLRSGFVTEAIRQGKSERSIMNQTGHKSSTVLRKYIQRESVFEDNAAEFIL